MSEQHAETGAGVIKRLDRYTIAVDDHHIRATEAQEAAIRRMDEDELQRFLTIMGRFQ